MLQFREQGVVVAAAVNAPVVAAIDLGIQGVAQSRGTASGFSWKKMSRDKAALIAQAHNVLVTQVVLHIERVVMRRAWWEGMPGKMSIPTEPLVGSPFGPKLNDKVRVRADSRRCYADPSKCRRQCRDSARLEWHSDKSANTTKPGLSADIGGNRDFFLVVVQAVTAAEHQAAVECGPDSRQSRFRAEVIFLRVPGISLV